jgi:DNA-binding MarR family transcriptional regulator
MQAQMNPEMSQSLGVKQPPAEADMRRHFDVTAPSVHQMVMTLEKAGLISRTPGAARSIQLLVPPEALPILR